jgi:allantoin racemase
MVARAIDEACVPLRISHGAVMHCVPLIVGPPGIERQRHADTVIDPLVRLVAVHEREHGDFAIGCLRDPGLHSVREPMQKPKLCIAEFGIQRRLHSICVSASALSRKPRPHEGDPASVRSD